MRTIRHDIRCHATATFGLGSTSATGGFGISTTKRNIALSMGTARFISDDIETYRNRMSKISSYVKGKAKKL